MTIYNDNAGNKFLGDCIYANHNISYPSINFLQAHPHSSISAELTALCTQAGLKFRNVLSQSVLNTSGSILQSLLTFASDTDTIDDRYSIGINYLSLSSGVSISGYTLAMFNDSGYTSTTNALTATNGITNFYFGNSFVPTVSNSLTAVDSWNFYVSGVDLSLYTNVNWGGVSDGKSLGLFITQKKLSTDVQGNYFFYAGLLDSINTNNNYYNQDFMTQSILIYGRTTNTNFSQNTSSPIGIAHRIANNNKLCLTTDDAQYPITCSDGQNPTAQWATDFYVFDNNDSFGYPAIGRVRNLLLAQGDYTIGKPVKISGTVQPDNGFNAWLPVGTFAGKTVLMRCYSSASL